MRYVVVNVVDDIVYSKTWKGENFTEYQAQNFCTINNSRYPADSPRLFVFERVSNA